MFVAQPMNPRAALQRSAMFPTMVRSRPGFAPRSEEEYLDVVGPINIP
jgi:hypothetical protein